MIILDTNIVSELGKKEPNAGVLSWLEAQTDEPLFLTVISLAELRSGVMSLPEGKRRRELDAFVSFIIEDTYDGMILAFDHRAAEVYAHITATLKKAGRSVGAHDAMIASIALAHDASVATRNTKDFAPCGSKIINPFDS